MVVPGRAAERPDVGLWDGGVGSYPGQQDPQGLGPLLREALVQPRSRACRSSSSTMAPAAGVRLGSWSRVPAVRQLQSRRASNRTVCAGSTRCGESGCAGGCRAGGCRLACLAAATSPGACWRSLSLRLAGSSSDDALGRRTPGRRNPSWSGLPGSGLSTHPGSSERMACRQGRHSPSRLTWLTRSQRRQASLAGEGPAPLGAGSAAGALPHLAPAKADRALPDRPVPR